MEKKDNRSLNHLFPNFFLTGNKDYKHDAKQMSHGWCLVTQVNAYRWQVMEALGGIAKDEATGMQRVEVKMGGSLGRYVNSWYQVDKV